MTIIEIVAKSMHDQALSDGWDGPPWEEMSPDSANQALGLAQAAIEAMRAIPEFCYDAYRCDKSWRDLDSVQVLNLWIDAALQ